jgi:putative oxidoreductase
MLHLTSRQVLRAAKATGELTSQVKDRFKMLRKLTVTDNSSATSVIRLLLGLVFFAHGAQKMLGWFGGYGFSGTMGFFTGVLHIPAVFAFLAIAAEFFGGLGLIFGVLTRVAAFGIAVTMLVAIAMVHGQFGLFMNWSGAQKGEGIEYHVLVLAMTVFLMIQGGGALSVDRTLSAGTADNFHSGEAVGARQKLHA